jgi:hypothetical protein
MSTIRSAGELVSSVVDSGIANPRKISANTMPPNGAVTTFQNLIPTPSDMITNGPSPDVRWVDATTSDGGRKSPTIAQPHRSTTAPAMRMSGPKTCGPTSSIAVSAPRASSQPEAAMQANIRVWDRRRSARYALGEKLYGSLPSAWCFFTEIPTGWSGGHVSGAVRRSTCTRPCSRAEPSNRRHRSSAENYSPAVPARAMIAAITSVFASE